MALRFRVLPKVLIWDVSKEHLEAETAAKMLRGGPGERWRVSGGIEDRKLPRGIGKEEEGQWDLEVHAMQ